MCDVLYKPSEFFEKVRDEPLMKTVFYYLFGIFLMVSFSAIAIYTLKLKTINVLLYYTIILLFAFMLFGLSFILAYVIYFLTGKDSWKNSFKVIAYSFYPFYLFGWTIIFGGLPSAIAVSLIYVWTNLLMISGLNRLYGISKTEAAVCSMLFFQIVAIIGLIVFLV